MEVFLYLVTSFARCAVLCCAEASQTRPLQWCRRLCVVVHARCWPGSDRQAPARMLAHYAEAVSSAFSFLRSCVLSKILSLVCRCLLEGWGVEVVFEGWWRAEVWA